jgi:mRNA-degrading endonuclease toxin of MazEF toxin-antitoxin module
MSLKELISKIITISFSNSLKPEEATKVAVELQPRGEVETCPAIVAPAMPETNATGGAVALHCSDDDKSLLADAGLLVDKLRPDASAELVKTINTLNEAEHAEDQESFDFALEVLRSVVDDARQLAPGETCGGVAYG